MKTNLAVLAVCIIGLMTAPAFAGDTGSGTAVTFKDGATKTALPDPDSTATRASRAAAPAYITFPSGNGQTDAFPGVSGSPGAVSSNSATGYASVVSGGQNNTNDATWTVIGGGWNNSTAAGYSSATVGGGATNAASNTAATVAGGADNVASGYFSTVGGGGSAFIGFGNEATGDYSTISGGYNGTASGNYSTVSGGYYNTASSAYSTVAGGRNNEASTATDATVGGGRGNTASGLRSTVAGGYNNEASGMESFAVGYNATATHNNSFVWGDFMGGGSAGTSTFNVHASGGIWLDGVEIHSSDRNKKKDFSFVSAREILDKVVELPIQTWRFKTEDDSINHIGPMAQDFMDAFGYGLDERYIASVDIDGVALAAVQGLNERLEEQLEVNTALRWHNAQLQAMLRSRDKSLEARFARLEKAILREDEAAGSE